MKQKFNKKLIIIAVVASFTLSVLGLTGPMTAFAATSVGLSDADSFAVLAGSGITNTGATTITGDVGTFPTTTETGFGTVTIISGTNHAGDGATQDAKTALTTAYSNAELQTPATTITADLGTFMGGTLTPGIYKSGSSIGLTGTVTLDGGGDTNAVFIFQTTASTLTTASNSHVVLTNGTQACNVFWQVGSSATLGTTSDFKGNILAFSSITDNGGSTIAGRLLAKNAAVTLNNTVVTKPTCTSPPPPPTPPTPPPTPPTPSPSPSPSPTPSPSPSPSSVNAVNTITVVKQVINDNGGTATYADFPLFINGNPISSGQSMVLAAGTYTITETNRPGYTRTFTGNCDANGQINHGGVNSHDDICTVVNNDVGAPPVAVVPPLIDVVKVPNPLALPGGPGPVTYTYTATNIGTVPMTDVTLVGDTCSPIVFVSGDTNHDSKLDVDESWVYRCTKTLTQTTKNTVTAIGHANGLEAIDVASAIVVVGAPVIPPLIHVTKIPDPLALPAGAGPVTYRYTVTNPGTAPLSNVFITDDKCTGLPGRVVGHPGDLNKNDLLESNESWLFTCETNLTQTTVNTAIASGEANGLTATDFALATVVVAVPKLPNTGLPPQENTIPWNIIIASGIFAAAIFFYVVRRKQAN